MDNSGGILKRLVNRCIYLGENISSSDVMVWSICMHLNDFNNYVINANGDGWQWEVGVEHKRAVQAD